MNNYISLIQRLIDRVNELPDEINKKFDVERKDFAGVDHCKLIIEEKYKRVELIDDIILEARGLIKTLYGKDSEYFREINNIKFLDKHHGFVINTINYQHDEFWYKGKYQLHSLLINIKFEEKAKMDINNLSSNKEESLRTGLFFCLLALTYLIIWQMPEDSYVQVFLKEKIFQAKIALSLIVMPLLIIIISPKSWKEMLGVFATLVVVAVALLK